MCRGRRGHFAPYLICTTNVTRPSGAKNNRKTKIGCYLATQMKISIISSSHSPIPAEAKVRGALKGDSMPTRGVTQCGEREREREGAFSDKSSGRILGKSEAVCRWKHDGLLDSRRDKRGAVSEPSASSSSNRAETFDEIPRATEIVFLLRE